MPLHLSAIEDPNFDREAAAHEQLHRRPHPLLPMRNLRKAALKEGFGWEVDELRGVVGLTATIDGTPHGAEVDLRALVDSDLDPDGTRITAQVISGLKRQIGRATTTDLHLEVRRLLEQQRQHRTRPTYGEWCVLRDDLQRGLGVRDVGAMSEVVMLDRDIAALQQGECVSGSSTPVCLVVARGGERLHVRWLGSELVLHAA